MTKKALTKNNKSYNSFEIKTDTDFIVWLYFSIMVKYSLQTKLDSKIFGKKLVLNTF